MASESAKAVARGIITFRQGFIRTLKIELEIIESHPEIKNRGRDIVEADIVRSEEMIERMKKILAE